MRFWLGLRVVFGRFRRASFRLWACILCVAVAQMMLVLPQVGIWQVQESLGSLASGTGFGNADFKVDRREGVPSFPDEDIEAIGQSATVSFLYPAECARLSHQDGSTVSLCLISPDEARSLSAYWLQDGRPLGPGSHRGILLSAAYARAREIAAGNTVRFRYRGSEVTLRVIGLISEHGFGRQATQEFGIGLISRDQTLISGKVIFLLGQVGNKDQLDETLVDLRRRFGNRYRFSLLPRYHFTNPKLLALTLWVGRAVSLISAVAVLITLALLMGNGVAIGIREAPVVELWNSIGITPRISVLILGLETFSHVFVAGCVTLGAAVFLRRVLPSHEPMSFVAAGNIDAPTILLLLAAMAGTWCCWFSARWFGSTFGQNSTLSRPAERFSSCWLSRCLFLVLGCALLVGAGYIPRLLHAGMSADMMPWLVIGAVTAAGLSLCVAVAKPFCLLLARVLSTRLAVRSVSRSGFGRSLAASGSLGMTTAVLLSIGIFTGVFLLALGIETLDQELRACLKEYVLVWTRKGTEDLLEEDLWALDGIEHIVPVIIADAAIGQDIPVRIAGIPPEAVKLRMFLADTGAAGASTIPPLKGSCYVTAGLSSEQHIAPGDEISFTSSRGTVRAKVLGILPPTAPFAQVFCDSQFVLENFAPHGPTFYVTVLKQSVSRDIFVEEMTTKAIGRYELRIFDAESEVKAFTPYLRSARLGIRIIVFVLMFVGALGVVQNCVLQFGFQQDLFYFVELGASRAVMCLEAFVSSVLITFVGVTLGRIIGQMLGTRLAMEMGRIYLLEAAGTQLSGEYWMPVLLVSVLAGLVMAASILVKQRGRKAHSACGPWE